MVHGGARDGEVRQMGGGGEGIVGAKGGTRGEALGEEGGGMWVQWERVREDKREMVAGVGVAGEVRGVRAGWVWGQGGVVGS